LAHMLKEAADILDCQPDESYVDSAVRAEAIRMITVLDRRLDTSTTQHN
jgi:hypothetical protein